MKILRSKVVRLVLVIMLTVSMFFVKGYIEQQAISVDTTKTIYVINSSFESKDLIESEDLKGIDISITSLPKGYIDNKSDAVGNYVIEPITDGDFVLSTNLTDDKHFEDSIVPVGYKIVSIPLNIDEAAGWKFDIDQNVDMVFSPFQYTQNSTDTSNQQKVTTLYKEKIIDDVKVVDIMNEALVSTDSKSFEGIPKYVVIMVKEKEAEFISMAKDKGRFDVLIKSQQ